MRSDLSLRRKSLVIETRILIGATFINFFTGRLTTTYRYILYNHRHAYLQIVNKSHVIFIDHTNNTGTCVSITKFHYSTSCRVTSKLIRRGQMKLNMVRAAIFFNTDKSVTNSQKIKEIKNLLIASSQSDYGDM